MFVNVKSLAVSTKFRRTKLAAVLSAVLEFTKISYFILTTF